MIESSEKLERRTIALVTDFGTRDYFVAAMKGVILSICGDAVIVDVTHEIEAQAVRRAAFVLRACYREFPVGTIFLAVVDPGVGSERRAVLVETEKYLFVAPDNGLLSFVVRDNVRARVRALANREYFAAEVSATFHGRDVFAPVAAHLARGVEPGSFGPEITDLLLFDEARPRRVAPDLIEAEIVEIDRFGNLITNLKRADLPADFALEIGGARVDRRRNYYAEADPGEVFMIFGSAGFLEIAAFCDSAESRLEVSRGMRIRVRVL